MGKNRRESLAPSAQDMGPSLCESGEAPKRGGMSRTKIVIAAFAALVTGTLLVVYAYRGEITSRAATQSGQEISQANETDRTREMAASEAAKPEETPAPKPESAAPKSEGKSTSPPAPPAAEVPPPGTPEVIFDFNRLPDEVRDT